MSETEKKDISVDQVKVAMTDKDEEYTFYSPNCPVSRVTVYADRAEVCRVINAKAKKGINEILLKKLPPSIDEDSIRVEGVGNATIEEVSFQRKFVSKDKEEVNQNVQELKDAFKILNIEKENLTSEIAVVKKQMDILNDFAKNAATVSPENKTELNDSYFTNVSKFLQLYKTEGSSLEHSRLTLERKLAEIQTKIDANRKNQNELNINKGAEESRECTIVVDAAVNTPIELTVSYVVSQASWIPSYDIRMFTKEGVMKIMYYGQIQQCTGEDWVDAKLFLSTASPSIGGAVPSLESVFLSFRTRYKMRSKNFTYTLLDKFRFGVLQDEDSGYHEYLPSCNNQQAMEWIPPNTEVADTTTSTSYEIARQATIPSDNIQHKVSVGIIDLDPRLEYISVPKKVPRAFLTAKLTNTSPFTLLPGPTSIFLDNSFVAKASMKSVSPQEEFECSLGVDPSVRVTYKPLKKFEETSGFISKTRTMIYEQDIEVKNTHDYTIKILIKDNLPRSDVDKIKVNLLEPLIDLKHPEKQKYIRFNNKQNHLEWDMTAGKQETKTITLKYSVEYPPSEEIEERAVEN